MTRIGWHTRPSDPLASHTKEWDIPLDETPSLEQAPGTWRWPQIS